MTDVFEFSEYERGKLLYEFTDMTPEQVIEKKLPLKQKRIPPPGKVSEIMLDLP
jgi:hypothetical protein